MGQSKLQRLEGIGVGMERVETVGESSCALSFWIIYRARDHGKVQDMELVCHMAKAIATV